MITFKVNEKKTLSDSYFMITASNEVTSAPNSPRGSIIGTRKKLLQANQRDHCARRISTFFLRCVLAYSTAQHSTAQHHLAHTYFPDNTPIAIGSFSEETGAGAKGSSRKAALSV